MATKKQKTPGNPSRAAMALALRLLEHELGAHTWEELLDVYRDILPPSMGPDDVETFITTQEKLWALDVVSYVGEVIADNSGQFVGNGLRFATETEAAAYVRDLSRRWTLVRETRTRATRDRVTHVWKDGQLARPILSAPADDADGGPVIGDLLAPRCSQCGARNCDCR